MYNRLMYHLEPMHQRPVPLLGFRPRIVHILRHQTLYNHLIIPNLHGMVHINRISSQDLNLMVALSLHLPMVKCLMLHHLDLLIRSANRKAFIPHLMALKTKLQSNEGHLRPRLVIPLVRLAHRRSLQANLLVQVVPLRWTTQCPWTQIQKLKLNKMTWLFLMSLRYQKR